MTALQGVKLSAWWCMHVAFVTSQCLLLFTPVTPFCHLTLWSYYLGEGGCSSAVDQPFTSDIPMSRIIAAVIAACYTGKSTGPNA